MASSTTLAQWESGLFGSPSADGCPGLDRTEEVCFAHNSGWRPWGNMVSLGRNNCIWTDGDIQGIVYINNAIDEIGYLEEAEPATADKPANGYFLQRLSSLNRPISNVWIDGLVYDPVSALEGDKFIYADNPDVGYTSSSCPGTDIGGTDMNCGSTVSYSNTQFFLDPANRDFTINTGDPAGLTGTAVPIAQTTSTGTGNTISVTGNRAQCFMPQIGETGYGYPGDVLDVNGDTCTVTSVNYNTDSITCNETITYASGENIRFVIDGVVHDDIGAISSSATPPDPGPINPGPGRELGKANLTDEI